MIWLLAAAGLFIPQTWQAQDTSQVARGAGGSGGWPAASSLGYRLAPELRESAN